MTRVRWATFLLGVWVAGSLIVSVVASQNFFTIDRLLADMPNPAFRNAVGRLGTHDARDLLRYLSSELNRLYFQMWNGLQIMTGAAILLLLRQGAAQAAARWIVTAMFAAVVLMIVWLAPQITALGRSLDFVARDPAPPQLGRFGLLHAAYATLEVMKGTAGIVAVALLIRAERMEARRWQEQR